MLYSPYYNTYQQPGYSQPMPDQLTALRQNQFQQPVQQPVASSPIIWVQGEAAARAYMVAAGNSVLLMDSDASVFYLKSTDASGMPQPLRIFDYKERTESSQVKKELVSEEYVTRKEFHALEERFDSLEGMRKGNAEYAESVI